MPAPPTNSSILLPKPKRQQRRVRSLGTINTKVFEFNRQLDRFVLKPVAKGYDFVVPDFVQVGISNMFYNLRFLPRFFNNMFQGKGQRRRD